MEQKERHWHANLTGRRNSEHSDYRDDEAGVGWMIFAAFTGNIFWFKSGLELGSFVFRNKHFGHWTAEPARVWVGVGKIKLPTNPGHDY